MVQDRDTVRDKVHEKDVIEQVRSTVGYFNGLDPSD